MGTESEIESLDRLWQRHLDSPLCGGKYVKCNVAKGNPRKTEPFSWIVFARAWPGLAELVSAWNLALHIRAGEAKAIGVSRRKRCMIMRCDDGSDWRRGTRGARTFERPDDDPAAATRALARRRRCFGFGAVEANEYRSFRHRISPSASAIREQTQRGAPPSGGAIWQYRI